MRNSLIKKMLLNAFFALVAFSLLTDGSHAQSTNLRSAKSVIINSDPNASRTFIVDVKKQQSISLEIKQNGMDVKAELKNPQGIAVASADYPLSAQEIERLFVVADMDGQYVLKIAVKFPDLGGSATFKLNKVTESSPADVKHAEAEKLFSQANFLRSTGNAADIQKAIEVYEQSLGIWQEIGNKFGELRGLSTLAYSYRVAGNYKKSREAVERILLFPSTDIYRKYQASALYEIGRIQTAKGENEQAILSFQDALRQFSEPSSEQAHIRLALGNLYQSIDEYELAQKFFDAALNDIRQFPDVYDESQAEHLIGLYNFNGNEFETAIGHFKTAAVLREKVGNRRGQAISLTFLGMTYQSLKMFDEAIEVFQKALPVSRELGDRINQMDTLIFIAYSLRGKGDSSKALELYEQALSLFDNKNSASLNALYLNRGVTNRKLFKFAEARGDFEKAELLYRQVGDMKGEAVTLYHFAILDGEENRLDEAKAKIERALQVHKYEQAKYKNIRRLSGFLETRRRFFDSYIRPLAKLNFSSLEFKVVDA